MNLSNPHSIPNQISFGAANNLPTGSGSYFEVDTQGYPTIGFNIQPPNNGYTQFQGSFDGINFEAFTLRQLGNDGYSQSADIAENYIGSVSSFRKVRFVNVTGALQTGTIIGTLSNQVSTLEGIEHNSPPHKFGNALFHIGVNVSGTATDSGIFFPSNRNKFAVTHLTFGASSTAGSYITLHEGSGTVGDPDKWVFTTYLKSNPTDTQLINLSFTTPHIADFVGSGLYLTVSNDAILRGVIYGYETEN